MTINNRSSGRFQRTQVIQYPKTSALEKNHANAIEMNNPTSTMDPSELQKRLRREREKQKAAAAALKGCM